MAPFSALQVANSGYSISLAVIQVFDTEMILKICTDCKNMAYYAKMRPENSKNKLLQ